MEKLFLICFLATAIACNSTQAVSDNKSLQNSNNSAAKIETKSTPTKVSINLKLDDKKTKELNKSLPPICQGYFRKCRNI